MKLIDLALNAITAFSVAVFVAYFGLRSGTGLFTKLPASITEIFTQHEGLQFFALAIVIAALIAKIFVARSLKRQRAGSRRDYREPRK